MFGDLRLADYDPAAVAVAVAVLLIAALVFVALLVAFVENWRWKEGNPGKLGFRLGFFFIYSTLIVNGLLLFAALLISLAERQFLLAPVFVFLIPVLAFCTVKALRRQKWALIAMTLLSLNPLWAIINIFYLKNRWVELGGWTTGHVGTDTRVYAGPWGTDGTGPDPERDAWRLTWDMRVAIFVAVTWAFAIGVYVALFNPYDGMSGNDFIHMLAVMSLPNSAALALYWGYMRFVR